MDKCKLVYCVVALDKTRLQRGKCVIFVKVSIYVFKYNPFKTFFRSTHKRNRTVVLENNHPS